LRKLNQEFGISILYISHDLTTTYQISDHIVVLYRGTVAEIGDIDQVIKDPKHPYSQLLVESIPRPDPTKRWSTHLTTFKENATESTAKGCKFAPYCPAVIPDLCPDSPPPMYQTHSKRAVRCFLYQDAHEIPGEEMKLVLDQ
jgi:peptide/nickel transport system ATP-binding protein